MFVWEKFSKVVGLHQYELFVRIEDNNSITNLNLNWERLEMNIFMDLNYITSNSINKIQYYHEKKEIQHQCKTK